MPEIKIRALRLWLPDLYVLLNSDLAKGKIEFDIKNGEGVYREKGADTWLPFSQCVPIRFVAGGWSDDNHLNSQYASAVFPIRPGKYIVRTLYVSILTQYRYQLSDADSMPEAPTTLPSGIQMSQGMVIQVPPGSRWLTLCFFSSSARSGFDWRVNFLLEIY